MRKFCSFLLALMLVLGLSLSAAAAPSSSDIVTTATGYDSADDVVYVTYTQSGKTVIANWGARGEDCVFLSDYAVDFYGEEAAWDVLSQLSGGTGTSSAPSSDLYLELQALMEEAHTFYTYYDGSKNVRDYYCYTDCVSSDISQVALLYRGGLKTSEWNQGNIWNQEHVWPKSKLSTSQQIGDIMHLRPANPNENSTRGNKAYGESSSYYDPGVSVRGDCARMVLYMYVRWGVTGTMWGSNGVIESLDILLEWMEEDPVDTWEMGRNDSVQSITGTRNVFVDYPEYAWLLFGREVPEDLVTPSGEAADQNTPAQCIHGSTEVRNATAATCVDDGYTGDTYCADCSQLLAAGSVIPATGEHILDETGHCTVCDYFEEQPCTHEHTTIGSGRGATCVDDGCTSDEVCDNCGYVVKAGQVIPATGEHILDETGHCTVCDYFEEQPCTHEHTTIGSGRGATCVDDGYTGDEVCDNCGYVVKAGQVIPATGEHILDETGHCVDCDYAECQHTNVTHQNQKNATCVAEGYTGDVYCADCGEFIAGGNVIPATGEHIYAENGVCFECGYDCGRPATQPTTAPDRQPQDSGDTSGKPIVWICLAIGFGLAAVVLLIAGLKKT